MYLNDWLFRKIVSMKHFVSNPVTKWESMQKVDLVDAIQKYMPVSYSTVIHASWQHKLVVTKVYPLYLGHVLTLKNSLQYSFYKFL